MRPGATFNVRNEVCGLGTPQLSIGCNCTGYITVWKVSSEEPHDIYRAVEFLSRHPALFRGVALVDLPTRIGWQQVGPQKYFLNTSPHNASTRPRNGSSVLRARLKSPSWDVIDTCKNAVVPGVYGRDSSRFHFFSDPVQQGWPWVAVPIRPGPQSRAVRGVLCVDR